MMDLSCLKRTSQFVTFVVFLFLSIAASGQNTEVLCNNGIDDDGDGQIDCLDGNCQFAVNIERGCNCYDGVDNDGDGKIDQADSNCAPYFGLTFVGEGSSCNIVPPGANTPFDLVGAPTTTSQNTADTQSKVAVGDVDGDGIPDVVITSKWNREIRLIATTDNQADGSDAGDVKGDFKTTGSGGAIFPGSADKLLFEHEVLIADINKDGVAEIFGVVSNRSGSPSSPPTRYYLVGFKYVPGDLVPLYNAVDLGTNRPGIFGIADMDGDGNAEIYVRDRIFAAETGKLLASEGAKTMANTALWDSNVPAGSVAVDIQTAGADGSKMELITGPRIYKIPTLTNRSPAAPAALILWRDMNTISFDINGGGADQYFVKLTNDPVEYGTDTHTAASVADMDKDGKIDVIVTGALNSSVGRTTVFYWNVEKNTVSGFMTKTSADLGYTAGNEPNYTNYLSGWIWGTGRVNIGDANGDGKLDLSFIAGNQLYCVTTNAPGTNITALWANPRTINDSRSGVLTVTIYDFDNDGEPEMVYRDSQELAVIDGATGTTKYWSAICQSHTYTEGPVIADVNGDGATDICVPCYTNASFDITDPIQQQALGQLRLYFSSGNEWLPCRKVWNMPGYHVVNINDDLTLPFPQLDPATVFSPGACLNGLPGPQTPLNVFLNQIPFLSSDGCPVFPAPDLSFIGDDPENLPFPPGDPRNFPAVTVIPPICGNLDIKVSFNIINDGDLPITDVIPVSFFHGDPTDPSTTSDSLLFSTNIIVNNLQVLDTLITAPVTFNGPGVPFRLYIVLNNNGTVLPVNPAGSVSNECRIDNNIYDVFVVPDPFTAVIQKIKDNDKCVPADPNVGELRARIYKGAAIPANEILDYSGYSFQWYSGIGTTTPVPAAQGGNNYNLTGLVEGDYTLVATNTLKGCVTVPVSETVLLNTVIPGISINKISDQTQCTPPNGSLEVIIAGGTAGYTIAWFDNATSLGVSTPTISNLVGGNYQVVVSRNGCTVNTSQAVAGVVLPSVTATSTPVVNCQNPNSGTVTATALVGGLPQLPAGYTFNWYFYNNITLTRGSILPPANGTGPTRTGLSAGYYEVTAVNNTTQCQSSPFVVQVVDGTVLPDVVITELAPQTSCDPANPNGRLQATVSVGGVVQNPSAFTFEWFVGQNTLPANLHASTSGVNGSIAEDVKGGGQSYTVKATSALQCFDTDDHVITEIINIPLITFDIDDNGICDPILAGTNFTGGVTANVTFGGIGVNFPDPNYTIQWYNGTQAIGAPRTETTNVLSPLDSGYYTVVVTRTDLDCESGPETAQVINTTVLPVITADANGSTNCDPPMPGNGGVQVTDVDGAGTPSAIYNFEWHRGINTTGYLIGNTAASLDSLQGATGRFYTVLVTNKTDGCQSTETVEVPDDHVIPLVSLQPFPNGICNPGLTNPPKQFGGRVESTISNQGATPIADYQFTWTDEETGTQVLQVTGAAGEDLLDRDSSYYTLIVRQVSTGCLADPVTAEVTSTRALPNITADANASTNCDPLLANGGVQVTDVDGAGTSAAMFTFEWRHGTTPPGYLISDVPMSQDTLQGATGRFYTVLVTKLSDGCQSTETVEVPDESELPVITLVATDNTICVGTPDGSASLNSITYQGATTNVPSAFAGYSFGWESGQATQALANQAAGFYKLAVTRNDVGCTSDSVSVEVEDDFFTPPIDIAVNNQTSCDSSNPNGSLTATINETMIGGGAVVTAGYSFSWVNNGNPLALPGTAAGATSAITGLKGNLFFTVEVERTSTGCTNTESVFVPEIIINPIVAAAVSNDVTRCDAPDGSIAADVGGAQAGFTFFWINEVGNHQTTNDSTVMENADASFNGNGNYPNLIPGYYTVVAQDNLTSCLSQPITREVVDNTIQTNINITLGPVFPSTCGSADGQMTGTIAGGVGPFDIFWHFGGPINDSINFFNNPPEFTPPNDVPFATAAGNVSALINLESRLYTLIVRDNGNGCGNYQTVFLPFQNAHIIDETVLPSTICPYTIGNGEIDVQVSNIPAVPPGLTFQSFSYRLYKGENPILANLVNPPGAIGPGAAVTNPVSYTALAPGKYTIEVKQEFSGGCPVYEVVEIESHALAPLVELVGALKPNTACDVLLGADGEATIQIDVDPNDQTTGFTYDIDVSPSPLGWGGTATIGPYLPPPLPDNFTITGLSPDNVVANYTITVTSSNNCVTQRFISIPNQPQVSKLIDGAVTIVDANLCTPSGSIEINSIDVIGGTGIDPDFTTISNYEFTWFDNIGLAPATGVFQGQGGDPIPGERLDNVSYTTISPGSYWVLSKKTLGTSGIGCTSAPFKADILDVSEDPAFTLTPFSNTACDANFEGSLRIVVTDPGSVATPTYTYDWDATNPSDIEGGTGPVAGNDGDGDGTDGDGDNPLNIQDGLYRVLVYNDATGCFTAAQSTITKSTTPVIVALATPVDQMICNPDGSITVNDVMVGGVVDPVHTNFDFTWYVSDPNSAPVISLANGVDVLDIVNLPTIGAGTYYVKAKRAPGAQPGSGCESAPLRVEIIDLSVDPLFTITPFSNTACDANFEGSLRIVVTDPGSVATPTFTYDWDAANPFDIEAGGGPVGGNDGDGDGTDGDGDNPLNIGDGTYRVLVYNDVTGCFTAAQSTITKSTTPVIVAQATPVDQMICNPDGSITVNDVMVGGVVDPVHTNFDFTWYVGDPNSAPVISLANGVDVLDIVNLPAIGAGTYYVKAKRAPGVQPGSGCESAPLRVEIDDLSVDPDVSFTFQPNSSCNPANPNGVIVATAIERNGTTDAYSFVWTLNGGGLPGVTTQTDISPTSQLNNSFEGGYAVNVTNTVTGCNYIQGFDLILDLSISLPNIVNIGKVDPINCFPTGSATVERITIGGTTTYNNPPDDIDTFFDYQWFKGSFPAGQLAGEVNSTLLNQFPDRYFVIVEDLTTNCESSPVEVVIDSTSIVYPDVEIQQTVAQISCDNLNGTAVLVSTADGQDDTNPNYTFTWFPSLDLSGTSFANTSTISNLSSGNYSVEVLNSATNCVASDLFIVPDNAPQFLPILSLSTTDRTRCDITDGSLSARGVLYPIDIEPLNNYPFPYNYTAELYLGDPPADINAPEFGFMSNDPANPAITTSFLETGLQEGMYTVRLTDLNTGCFTIDAIEVIDGRVYPAIVIVEDTPMTNCDPARPNGQLSATADGGLVGGYSFEWFAGAAPVGAVLSSNNKLIGQTVGSYTVQVTNDVTGCPNDATEDVTDGTVRPPLPTPELIRERTSCIFPNGWVAASVNGETLPYVFDWYDGSTASGSPDYTGTDYIDRDVDDYTVTATDIFTGCVSLPVTIPVPDGRIYPQVVPITTPSFCLTPTGTAVIELAPGFDGVFLTEMYWYDEDNNQISVGPAAYDLRAGEYFVRFITSEGCERDTTVTVGTEILSYNLVSVNSDGQNDYWHIDCIENFTVEGGAPRDNNVKVFNRSGVKVYEADGYNNTDVRFRGIGEQGVYAFGNELPDGTYFYIIDKRNGSRPITGYLELIR